MHIFNSNENWKTTLSIPTPHACPVFKNNKHRHLNAIWNSKYGSSLSWFGLFVACLENEGLCAIPRTLHPQWSTGVGASWHGAASVQKVLGHYTSLKEAWTEQKKKLNMRRRWMFCQKQCPKHTAKLAHKRLLTPHTPLTSYAGFWNCMSIRATLAFLRELKMICQKERAKTEPQCCKKQEAITADCGFATKC